MPSDAEPADSSQPTSFEAALADLGEIVARLESGSLGLSESITSYERGVGLLRRLHEELAVAEEKVGTLVRIDEAGRPILAPLAAAGGGEPAPPNRSPGRRQRSRRLPGMDDAGAEG